MNGGKNRQPLGYTIIEVMIVLAVSGIMFLIAATFINGKQERASFTAGVDGMASNIQDTIEQVTDGQYSDISLNCTGPPTDPNNSVLGTPGQGTNPSCVFLGKMFNFIGPLPNNTYNVLSVAGSRLDSSGNPATSVADASPAVICSLALNSQAVPQSLQIERITINGDLTGNTIGFFQGLQGQGGGGPSTLPNGSQIVQLYYYSGPQVGCPGSGLLSGSFQLAQSVDICLTDGTQYADIFLGTTSNSQLNANTQIDGTTRPASC